jgi:hypothetical protein
MQASSLPMGMASSESMPTDAVAAPLAHPEPLKPWNVIWLLGGAVWLLTSCLSLIWLMPWSGTRVEGGYVPSMAGLAVKEAMVFVAAAACYRGVIAMGWPRRPRARVRAAILNLLMVLAILAWSEAVDALVTGFVDERPGDMQAGFHIMFQFLWRPVWLAALLRSYFIPYALGLCAVVLALVINRRHCEAVRAAELARAYAATRMAMLSAQLQPHFLFNSLNALTELIEENPRKASTMVVRLGHFLRHALESGSTPWVPLATELEGLETYLDIQRVRFGDAVRISTRVDPRSLAILVPSMIMQPLVENAIEHGRRACGGGALEVGIEGSLESNCLRIDVRNDCSSMTGALSPGGYGRGLSNVASRLRAAYGDAARMAVFRDEARGTVAALELPLRRAVEQGSMADD